MNQRTGECPVCKQNITAQDDAVVCPDCGTPYHRACWQKNGACVHADKHGTGYEYAPGGTAEKQAPPGASGAAAGYDAPTAPCPKCHAQNNARNIFCERCGSPMHGQAQQPGRGMGQTPPPFGGGAGMPGFSAPQVDLSGDIDGIPKRDWNVYIGSSQSTYLPRLEQQKQRGTKLGFIFSAFFFPQFYFAYRKMWGWAALATGLFLLSSVPQYMDVLLYSGVSVFGMTEANIATLANISTYVYMLARFLCGVFSLWLYRRKGAKQMKALREKYADENQYQAAIKHAGGPSWLGAVLVGVVVLAFVIASSVFLIYMVPEDVLLSYLQSFWFV